MRKILSIIKREYIQIVRTKGFIIGTILGPILMMSFILVPFILTRASVEQQEKIGIIDETNEILPELEKKLNYKLKDGSQRYLMEEYKLRADIEELKSSLNQKVLDKKLSAYIHIPDDVFENGMVEYASEHVSDFDKIRSISQALNSVVIGKRLKKEGLDMQKIAEYTNHVPLRTVKVTKKGVEEDVGGTWIFSYILVIILYMTLFFYGSIILRGVIEEKTSRVVEIVLSSLRPFQLMLGKIIGIAAVGFTQYAIWAFFGLALTKYGGSLVSQFSPLSSTFKVPSIPIYVFVYFVIFFILGYFLYGTIYAAIGSMVNSEKEAQQLLFPVSMFLIVPILMMIYVIRAPNSSLAVILSMIPFFTPVLMLLRVSVLLPPFIQVGGSILLLILTTLGMVWIASKIYRTGILMYGKRPNLGDIVRKLKHG